MTTSAPAAINGSVARIEVRPSDAAGDPVGRQLVHDANAIGVEITAARTAKIYLIEAPLTAEQIEQVATKLLADPVAETFAPGASADPDDASAVEVHPLPGVMDPAAASVADALRELFGIDAAVSTGRRYELVGATPAEAKSVADRLLANAVVAGVHAGAYWPESLPKGAGYELSITRVEIITLDDDGLMRLSRDGHLFLSLDEMQAIQTEYRTLGREPTDVELETLAQTWSEHCVHKTLKSTIRLEGPADGIDFANRPGHEINADGSVTIHNLLKSTVAAATFELMEEGLDWTLSVFVDNAGIVKFDDDNAVCIKVETHNHPSALEPYGGAATGIGGCIRDIIGTGLAAKPIAATDVFCVAHPDMQDVPAGCLPPKRILSEVVAGVRDYGNRMGIPTLNGAVWFDDRYVGNPLVYCGCIGVMPNDLIAGDPNPGDLIVALGGRTGRDGIHGATFSSAELTDTHADEFSHAVQIGNAIEEKRVLDAILRARDTDNGPLFTSITDCGAGGFSSAVGEMGEKLGADVHLDKAPLKYDGLSYTEIWISEAQERMVLAVPPSNLDALQQICDEEHVELAVLGTFGTDNKDLVLNYHGTEVGRLPMAFLHDGIPTPTRTASWSRSAAPQPTTDAPPSISEALLKLLAHPNIASKHAIIRQYDHEVQGNTIIKPLLGPRSVGPSDAAVIEPVAGTGKGLAIACGLATLIGDTQRGGDPYLMALAAIDEAVRNLVATGADPDRIAILDNFCWPSCGKPENLASLVRAAEGCYDAAKAYRTPFVSGKDSLNNQFTTESGRTIEIPPTLLITGIAPIHDLGKVMTSDPKSPGYFVLLLVGETQGTLLASHYEHVAGPQKGDLPRVDLEKGPDTARKIHTLIQQGLVHAVHDVSDGGALTAVAEMLIAAHSPDAPIGAEVTITDPVECFDESPSRYIIEAAPHDVARIRELLGDTPCTGIANLNDSGAMSIAGERLSIEELTHAWRSPLDW